MTAERELKLHVPAAARAAIGALVNTAEACTVRLHALYFDTPDGALGRAGVALRLRLEGDQWVQTLKMPGGDNISKVEINHSRPEAVLDLSLYHNTNAAPVIAAYGDDLVMTFETDIRRTYRPHHTDLGSAELAYDRGLIRAGEFELPVCELEIELKSGRVETIFELGRRWVRDHGLIVDWRNKAERGAMLALSWAQVQAAEPEQRPAIEAQVTQNFWAPVKANPYPLDNGDNPHQALKAITEECLSQIIRNAAIVAEVDTAGTITMGTPEHIHQLRVGMRRLSSIWSLFKGLTPLPDRALRKALKTHFKAFGQQRDIDVMLETVVPKLRAADCPEFDVRNRERDAAQDNTNYHLVTNPEFQGWLVDMLAWYVVTPPPTSILKS